MEQEYTELLYEDARRYLDTLYLDSLDLDALDPEVVIKIAEAERLRQRKSESNLLDGGSAHG